jgi:hypothetical protein
MIAALTAGAAVCSFAAAYATNQVLPVRPVAPVPVVVPPMDAVPPPAPSVGGVQKGLPPPPVKSRIGRGGKGF